MERHKAFTDTQKYDFSALKRHLAKTTVKTTTICFVKIVKTTTTIKS